MHGREQCTNENNAMLGSINMLGSRSFTRPHDSPLRQICCATLVEFSEIWFPCALGYRRTIFSKLTTQRGSLE